MISTGIRIEDMTLNVTEEIHVRAVEFIFCSHSDVQSLADSAHRVTRPWIEA